MKGAKGTSIALLLLAVVCFGVAPAYAGDGVAAQQNGKSDVTVLTAVEDPGGQNSKGIPSHDDDWSRKDKPNNGNWGKGKNPGEGLGANNAGQDFLTALRVAVGL